MTNAAATTLAEPARVGRLLAGCPAPWWIAGGWAIDVGLGRQIRAHSDIEGGILRRDQSIVRDALGSGWDFDVVEPPAARAARRPWRWSERLAPPVHEIHGRHARHGELELLLNEADGDVWVYRREPSIGRPLAAFGRPFGIPALPLGVALL